MPELIEPGVNGFLVSDRSETVIAVEEARRLDRSAVRHSIEGRFDASRMVDDYLSLYHRLLGR